LRPPVRGRSPRHLSLVEREEISRVSLRVSRCGWWRPVSGVTRRRSDGNWPVTVTGSVVGLITLIGQRYPELDVPNHRNSLNIGGWVGLLRRNSRIGGQPGRQSTNPMPSRSARLRCPVWPVWRGFDLVKGKTPLLSFRDRTGSCFEPRGGVHRSTGGGMTDPVPGR